MIRISQVRSRMPLILARDRQTREWSSRANPDRSVATASRAWFDRECAIVDVWQPERKSPILPRIAPAFRPVASTIAMELSRDAL